MSSSSDAVLSPEALRREISQKEKKRAAAAVAAAAMAPSSASDEINSNEKKKVKAKKSKSKDNEGEEEDKEEDNGEQDDKEARRRARKARKAREDTVDFQGDEQQQGEIGSRTNGSSAAAAAAAATTAGGGGGGKEVDDEARRRKLLEKIQKQVLVGTLFFWLFSLVFPSYFSLVFSLFSLLLFLVMSLDPAVQDACRASCQGAGAPETQVRLDSGPGGGQEERVREAAVRGNGGELPGALPGSGGQEAVAGPLRRRGDHGGVGRSQTGLALFLLVFLVFCVQLWFLMFTSPFTSSLVI